MKATPSSLKKFISYFSDPTFSSYILLMRTLKQVTIKVPPKCYNKYVVQVETIIVGVI